ncbi:hypothetical protein NDU88_005720 [Pleurodeles waltl]|uniref:Uncharacterized protein n=1 Tax=Pleurodeles waltl TaxID=8319 RepID=A0AAV7TUS7_PLEWA|nr:hypothetical protein NDU88_005720 [Pleurodeles waltl]
MNAQTYSFGRAWRCLPGSPGEDQIAAGQPESGQASRGRAWCCPPAPRTLFVARGGGRLRPLPASVHSRERVYTQEPGGRLGRAAALAALVPRLLGTSRGFRGPAAVEAFFWALWPFGFSGRLAWMMAPDLR